VTARRVALAVGVIAFLAVSALLARWLSADGAERAKVERLLTAQARGDAGAMARELERCDAACEARLERLTTRLGRDGELEIVRYDSRTARALKAETGPTRVVWQLPGTLPVVQCIGVRRTGGVVAGMRVTLVGVSAPIGREAPC
jgi:hypothetical protein